MGRSGVCARDTSWLTQAGTSSGASTKLAHCHRQILGKNEPPLPKEKRERESSIYKSLKSSFERDESRIFFALRAVALSCAFNYFIKNWFTIQFRLDQGPSSCLADIRTQETSLPSPLPRRFITSRSTLHLFQAFDCLLTSKTFRQKLNTKREHVGNWLYDFFIDTKRALESETLSNTQPSIKQWRGVPESCETKRAEEIKDPNWIKSEKKRRRQGGNDEAT